MYKITRLVRRHPLHRFNTVLYDVSDDICAGRFSIGHEIAYDGCVDSRELVFRNWTCSVKVCLALATLKEDRTFVLPMVSETLQAQSEDLLSFTETIRDNLCSMPVPGVNLWLSFQCSKSLFYGKSGEMRIDVYQDNSADNLLIGTESIAEKEHYILTLNPCEVKPCIA